MYDLYKYQAVVLSLPPQYANMLIEISQTRSEFRTEFVRSLITLYLDKVDYDQIMGEGKIKPPIKLVKVYMTRKQYEQIVKRFSPRRISKVIIACLDLYKKERN